MAIGHIGVGDEESISKINEAIDKANLVDGKLDKTATGKGVLGRTTSGFGNVVLMPVGDGLEIAEETLRIPQCGVKREHIEGKAITNNRLDDMPAQTLKGRSAGTAGEPADLTVSQVKSMLGVTAVEEALTAEAQTRASEDGKRPLFGQSVPPTRPGEAVRYFADDLDGEPTSLTPLADSAAVASPYGKVVALNDASQIAPIAAWRIEPGHLYRLRFVLRRAVDTEDPANDAVRLGVRWLAADKEGVGTTQLANILDLTAEDGRVEYLYTLATTDASDVDAVPLAGGVYFRPFVRTFGSGTTHVEVIQVVDATDAVVWSPNVEILQREIASLTAQIQTLSDRVQTLES